MDPWGRLFSRPRPTIEFQAGERPCVQKPKWMVAWRANAKFYLRLPTGILPLKHSTHTHMHHALANPSVPVMFPWHVAAGTLFFLHDFPLMPSRRVGL